MPTEEAASAGVSSNPNVIPPDIIPANLPHPEILGGVLERGLKYGHHFVVELISDGKRLWAVASDEGQRVIAEIEGRISRSNAAIESHQGAGDPLVMPPPPNPTGSLGEALGEGFGNATLPQGHAVSHEQQGTGVDSGAAGHELQGRDPAPVPAPVPDPSIGTAENRPTEVVTTGNSFG